MQSSWALLGPAWERIGFAMIVNNVTGIHDNGEFVTILTKNVSIHLPKGDHTITVQAMENPGDEYYVNVNVEFYNE